MRSKYGSRKVTVSGITFDSRKEARRYQELLLLVQAGKISDLRRQVKYQLIPPQRAASSEVYARGIKKGAPKPGKLLEKECSYIADFVYTRNGETVVEDVKGYKIKRRLMLERHGIQIQEV